MALTYLPMLLQQDVNKLYPDILNYEVIPPPHWHGRVNHTFFLKRRGGLVQDVDFGGDKLLDYLELGGIKYGLVKDGTSIKVLKSTSVTPLFTGTYSTVVNHRLLLMSGCSGILMTNGTGATASASGGVYKIIDSTQSWVVNSYAGKYVYIQTADTGQGQTFRISSNTATELILERGREVLPSNITFSVFSDFSEVPAVVSNDGLYLLHNDAAVYKAENFGTVIDAIYSLGRTMAVDINDNVIVSYQGYNSLFLDQTSIIGTYSGVKSMVQFQDFVLMLSNTRIGMIKKETVTVVSSESIEVFKPVTITNLLGTFSAKSFSVYNQGLYLFTSARRFVAITITPSGTDRYIVAQEDQGAYIQQFLDSIADADDVAVAINAEKIVIINSNATTHNMYIYDTYYKFWHRRDTLLPIHGAVVFNDIFFLGDRLYTYNKGYSIDYGNNDYTPYIRVIFGESDIFSLKNIVMNKIYLGKNTDPSTTIKWKCHLDGGVYTLQTTFAKLKYLLEAAAYGGDGTLGSNVLGFGIFGGYGVSVSDYIISAINTVEIPTNFTCTLMEIEMTGDLEFGGIMIGYDIMEPVVTPINSVLGL